MNVRSVAIWNRKTFIFMMGKLIINRTQVKLLIICCPTWSSHRHWEGEEELIEPNDPGVLVVKDAGDVLNNHLKIAPNDKWNQLYIIFIWTGQPRREKTTLQGPKDELKTYSGNFSTYNIQCARKKLKVNCKFLKWGRVILIFSSLLFQCNCIFLNFYLGNDHWKNWLCILPGEDGLDEVV